jgi:hypothetical protein
MGGSRSTERGANRGGAIIPCKRQYRYKQKIKKTCLYFLPTRDDKRIFGPQGKRKLGPLL